MQKKSLLQAVILLILLFILAAPAGAFAGRPQTADRTAKPDLHMELLADRTGQLTIKDIVSRPTSGKFMPHDGRTLNFGFSNAAYWLRFRLPDNLDPGKNYLLEVGFPLIDNVDLYIPAATGGFTIKKAGELVPISDREFRYRNPIFPLSIPEHQGKTLYIRFQDSGSVPFSLALLDANTFTGKLKDQQYGLGIYYGAVLIIIIYNLTIFLMTGIKTYLHYVVYVGSYMLWQMTYNGLAGEYLWPGLPWLTNLAIPFLICASGLFALNFTRTFLRTAINTPRLDKVLAWLMVGFGLVMPLALFSAPALTTPLSALLALIFAPAVLISSLLSWKNGYRPARYFAIAWFMLLCGTAVLGLKSFGLLPSVFITEYGQQIGSVLEIALLSLALADRVNIMKQEKEEAQARALQIQAEAARELENQVRKRTSELHDSYRSLEHLSSKLAKYLAPQVYSSIFSGKTKVAIHSQRRKLTIFFSDIKDFTKLTDSMEPEALTGLINNYLDEMSRIILEHGGTIDKFMGDAIMVFFGDPETRGVQADAEACVRMAIAMRSRLDKLRRQWKTSAGPGPLRIRIGINTGYCTVGNVGSKDRLDYTVIGGQVNLASRLEKEAEADQILISEKTYNLVRDTILCREKGLLQVRGIAYPVKTYQVVDRHECLPAGPAEIKEEGEGYSIRLDLKRMPARARQQAADSLEKALARL